MTERRKKNTLLKRSGSVATSLDWTIDRVKQDIVEKSLKDEAKKVKNTRSNHKGMVVVPYVQWRSHGGTGGRVPHLFQGPIVGFV